MSNISERLMLASECLSICLKLHEEIPVQESIYNNKVLPIEFTRFVKTYINNIEDIYEKYNDYLTDKQIIHSKLDENSSNYKMVFMNDEALEIEDDDITEFLFNLLVAYKCLVLVNIKSKSSLSINKKDIIKLKELSNHCINSYLLKQLYILDNHKANRILAEIENEANEFICCMFPN